MTAAAVGLRLADTQGIADLRTFVQRARAAADGAIRLQAVGRVLAAYVCVMAPLALGERTPTILGLRTMALGRAADLDVTVALAAVADRLARMDETDVVLPVPLTTLAESWAGIGAPRSGWQSVGTLDADRLTAAAKAGIREVAEIVPASPGALMVNNARAAVWGRTLDGSDGRIPAGAAFAAYALGFLSTGEQIILFANGPWLRLSNPRGHVLVRRPAVL